MSNWQAAGTDVTILRQSGGWILALLFRNGISWSLTFTPDGMPAITGTNKAKLKREAVRLLRNERWDI